MNVPGFDAEEFLNRKHYSLEFRALLGDIEDFLEFSEYNLEWQLRREIKTIELQDLSGYPREYRDHLLENAQHRFTVSLPMRLRYAALVALTTTVEWECKFLAERATFRISKAPKQTNETVHRLRRYNEVVSLGSSRLIDDYERIVFVRNAIVHSAGVERDYKHREELKRAISKLKGFSISSWHAWLGPGVTIQRDALKTHIQALAELLPRLWETANQKGLLKRDT